MRRKGEIAGYFMQTTISDLVRMEGNSIRFKKKKKRKTGEIVTCYFSFSLNVCHKSIWLELQTDNSLLIDRLYGVYHRLSPFSTIFQLHRESQCTYSCFPGVLLTSTPHNILSKPLTAFPHNHRQINGQR